MAVPYIRRFMHSILVMSGQLACGDLDDEKFHLSMTPIESGHDDCFPLCHPQLCMHVMGFIMGFIIPFYKRPSLPCPVNHQWRYHCSCLPNSGQAARCRFNPWQTPSPASFDNISYPDLSELKCDGQMEAPAPKPAVQTRHWKRYVSRSLRNRVWFRPIMFVVGSPSCVEMTPLPYSTVLPNYS